MGLWSPMACATWPIPWRAWANCGGCCARAAVPPCSISTGPRIPAGLVARFQRFYLSQLVVPLARQADLEAHYAYLEESLARFPTGPEQESLARQAGFKGVYHRPLAGGQMGLLELVA